MDLNSHPAKISSLQFVRLTSGTSKGPIDMAISASSTKTQLEESI